MSLRPSQLLAVFAAVTVTLAAYWLGRQNGAATPAAEPAAPIVRTAVESLDSSPTPSATTDEDFATLFAEVRAACSRGYWNLNLNWQQRFSALNSAQLRTLTDFIVRAEPSDSRGQLRRALYEQWAQIDPRAALAHAGGIEFVRTRDDAYRSVFRGWSFANVTDLEQWVRSEPPGERRDEGIRAMATQVDDLSPELIFGYLAESGLLERGGLDTFSLFSAWMRGDPQKAIAEITSRLDGRSRASTLNNLARIWAGSDPQAALSWAQSQPAHERGMLSSTVLTRWARRDPQAAASAAWSLSTENAFLGGNVVPSVLNTWAEVDPDAALAWTRGQPPGSKQREAIGSVLQHLLDRQPDAAIAFLEANPDELAQLSESAARSLGNMAQSDPDKALALAMQLPTGRSQNAALQNLLNAIARTDPARALALVHDPAFANTRSEALGNIIGQLAQTDPEAAIAAVQQLPSAQDREKSLMQIVFQLSRQDHDLADVFASAISPGDAQRSAYFTLARAKLQADPVAAAQWVDQIADLSLRRQIGSEIAGNWMKENPAATLAWIAAQTDADTQNQFYAQAGSVWAQQDPAGFVQALLAEPNSPRTLGLVQGNPGALARVAPELALQAINQMPDGEARSALIGSTVVNLAQRNPAQAQQLIGTLPPGETRHNAINNFISNAAQVMSGDALATWLDSMPLENNAPTVYANLAGNWMHRDAEAAMQWADDLPAGPYRDSAVAGLATSAAIRGNVNEVTPLLLSIQNVTERDLALRNAYGFWRRNDPTAAREWIESLPLQAEEKARLLDPTSTGN
ncbi:hypothetical protein [Actomonas aquatica]|uniref:DUF4034 domain-containing protein n=1 Tax=Actomonas aquatica TaxID=2866162 RepID=A0ABZ1C551_9BACT|nr:hypothetical protein [Opitutus sp. WL0086]WRQ86646.1 hypothetical protein K1X11_017680 [Opitutus sp. WL0086]